MYGYPGDGLTSHRLHHQQPPPLSVPDRIHPQHQHHHQYPGYISAPPPQSLPPHQNQIQRMPHKEDDRAAAGPTGPGPEPYRTNYDGKIWSLEVVQQPVRARMCGFGDKDRRPITPPPCVRLTILDAATGKEISVNDIDTQFFVVTVDLWDASGMEEQNLVRNPATSPSISAAGATAYPFAIHHASGVQPQPVQSQLPQPNKYGPTTNGYSAVGNDPRNDPRSATSSYYSAPSQYASSPTSAYGPLSSQTYQPAYSHGYNGPHSAGLGPASPYYQSPMTPGGNYSPNMPIPSREPMLSREQAGAVSPTPGQYNRNLIGSLSASAFQLTDPDNKIGIWFIMQDLSVRQEGSFRLKMSFVDVGDGSIRNNSNNSSNLPVSPHTPSSNGSMRSGNGLRQTAPVLATCFSEVFTVYSAKRFPGVIESTPLSKCFASQGIKIPIRQMDKPVRKDANASDDDDDDVPTPSK